MASNDLYRGVQVDLSNAHTYRMSWAEMARQSGLAPSTVKKFVTGETNRPSFETVVALAEIAGYAVEIARSNYLRAVK